MRLSINSRDSSVWTGHGYVTLKLMSTLAKLGHSVVLDRPCEFEMTFSHPKYYKFYGDNSYKIGYTAWESTDIPDDWHEGLSQIDELWVPNSFCKEVLSDYFDKDIYVFPHGVDEKFSYSERAVDGVIKFLHIGHPAYRKGLDLVLQAWEELYANNPKYHLTVKGYNDCSFPRVSFSNVTFISETVKYEKMVEILHEHHILVYPSWGEGYGLIPLQALATGMPVIMTDGWSDYNHLVGDLLIDSTLVYTPWQIVHPGKMFKPNYATLKNLMVYAAQNIDELLSKHSDISMLIHKEHSWDAVVEKHFKAVEGRLVV